MPSAASDINSILLLFPNGYSIFPFPHRAQPLTNHSFNQDGKKQEWKKEKPRAFNVIGPFALRACVFTRCDASIWLFTLYCFSYFIIISQFGRATLISTLVVRLNQSLNWLLSSSAIHRYTLHRNLRIFTTNICIALLRRILVFHCTICTHTDWLANVMEANASDGSTYNILIFHFSTSNMRAIAVSAQWQSRSIHIT